MGYSDVLSETYTVGSKTYANLSVEVRGRSKPSEIVIVGGHYDSVVGCPGANDNVSGTAAVLALARLFLKCAPARTLRSTAFTNEEPPHFQTGDMGSRICARNCRERGENVIALLSLETIGFYSDAKGSQIRRRSASSTRRRAILSPSWATSTPALSSAGPSARSVSGRLPSEGAALPDFIPGVGWSDHWSFWQEGYPAIMVTDTALLRYPHYHTATDTAEKIDYLRCGRVVHGLREVIADLSELPAPS